MDFYYLSIIMLKKCAVLWFDSESNFYLFNKTRMDIMFIICKKNDSYDLIKLSSMKTKYKYLNMELILLGFLGFRFYSFY